MLSDHPKEVMKDSEKIGQLIKKIRELFENNRIQQEK